MTQRPDWLREDATRALLAAFAAHGQALRFVGGCVRDTLMERPVGDLDAATPAMPGTVMALLEAEGIKTIPTGLKHGTVTAIILDRQIEITTLREDAACDGRHAEVRYTDDWQRDAARRDFTMNALYMDAAGEVYDYFGGLGDLAARRLRFIGDPVARIREDYLRILRFFRFYATHAAPPPDEEALAACTAEATGIANLSGERIRAEMFKLLAAPDPVPSLKLMEACGVLKEIGVAAPDYAALELPAPADPLLQLLLLLGHVASPNPEEGADILAALALSERWRLSNAERDRLTTGLVTPTPEKITDAQAKAFLRREGETCYRDWIWRWHAQHPQEAENAHALLALPERWPVPLFPVTGKDLLARGVPQGEGLGKLLAELEAAWEASDYTLDKEALLKRIGVTNR